MAQGEFTKEEAVQVSKIVEKMFAGMPFTRRVQYIGHLNDILLFVQAAKDAAPHEKDRPDP